MIDRLIQNEQNIALVSDAGMPLVNDPGFEIVKLANENNISIEIIPGVSASITAFALSGLSSTFVYMGFLKKRRPKN
nr:SAM-dependent methyltransferase [Mycoplasmopsis agalactiae]